MLLPSHLAFARTMCLIVCLISCEDRAIQVATPKDVHTLEVFLTLPDQNKLAIAEPWEPGTKLRLCLTFVNTDTRKPLANQKVQFYQTDTNGNYQPADPNDESTARLSGAATTDLFGRIFLETILPGNYSSSADSRHIHTTVFGARPEAYDIHFRQYTGFMGKRFIDGSSQHFLADLMQLPQGSLMAILDIRVRPDTTVRDDEQSHFN